jgi:uncharacterized glyoxalase superfamily protein PhnB
MTETVNGAFPIVPYPDPREAIVWLERAFGAVATMVHPPDPGPGEPIEHAEILVGTGIVMLSDTRRADTSPFALAGPVVVYVVVDDPDALHERAVAAGAQIIRGLTDQSYGSREFAARDHAGNIWSFGTYRPAAGPS